MRPPDSTDSGLATARPEPVVLLSETAYGSFEHALRAAAPHADWAVMSADGRLRFGECGGDRIDVAWATADLFTVGGLRPFMSLVKQAASLRWLQAAGAGLEHPVYEELHRRGVRITSNHSSTTSIVEFVMRAVLDAFQDADRWRQAEQTATWVRHDFREIAGSRWVVVGLGHIGTAVARRAAAFGATTIGVRRDVAVPSDAVERVVAPEALRDVVEDADVVVLAAPHTADTERMVDAHVLERMRPHAVLVNVARGGLIDEVALLDALRRGRPGRAVLDVFDDEPLPADHPFWRHTAVTVTPHASGMGEGRYRRGADLFVENLARWQDGRPMLNEAADPASAHRRPADVGENR